MLRFMAFNMQEGFLKYIFNLLLWPLLHRTLQLNTFPAGTTEGLILCLFPCPACAKPPAEAEESPALEEMSSQFSLLAKHKADKLCLNFETLKTELSLESRKEIATH